MTFPEDHWSKIHSTNPLERLNKEIKRRTNVVGIFPNEAAITRLVGAILAKQNDAWAVSRRYMTLETLWAIRKTFRWPSPRNKPATSTGEDRRKPVALTPCHGT